VRIQLRNHADTQPAKRFKQARNKRGGWKKFCLSWKNVFDIV